MIVNFFEYLTFYHTHYSMKHFLWFPLIVLFAFQPLAPNPIRIEMVQIPASKFFMGKASPIKGEANEYPLHKVSVGAFQVGKFEITQAQFDLPVLRTVIGLCPNTPAIILVSASSGLLNNHLNAPIFILC
jgi:hypothetical protein